MAFADLSFAAALWEGRGLRWLAAPADLPPGLSLAAPAVAGAPERPESAPRRPEARPQRAPRRAQAPGDEHKAPREQAPTRQATRPVPGGRWRPLAPEALPGHWRRRLGATRPGLVAWTYWALGEDLAAGGASAPGEDAGAEARALRRAFLARLLRDLAHPGGTHTFWPAGLPPEGENAPAHGAENGPAPHAEAFWSGAAHLGCRAVIVMGSAAVRALGLPPEARPFAQLRWRGQLVLVLRDVDALATDAARYAPTLAFLRQGLAPVARLPR